MKQCLYNANNAREATPKINRIRVTVKMDSEVGEADHGDNTSDSDSTNVDLLETNDIPGNSDNTLLVASDSYEELEYIDISDNVIRNHRGTIHALVKKKPKHDDSDTLPDHEVVEDDIAGTNNIENDFSGVSLDESQEESLEVRGENTIF